MSRAAAACKTFVSSAHVEEVSLPPESIEPVEHPALPPAERSIAMRFPKARLAQHVGQDRPGAVEGALQAIEKPFAHGNGRLRRLLPPGGGKNGTPQPPFHMRSPCACGGIFERSSNRGWGNSIGDADVFTRRHAGSGAERHHSPLCNYVFLRDVNTAEKTCSATLKVRNSILSRSINRAVYGGWMLFRLC